MIPILLTTLAIGALLKRLHRAESLAAELASQRGEAWAEIGNLRRQLSDAVDHRNCAQDIATGLLEEHDSMVQELEALRGGKKAKVELAN